MATLISQPSACCFSSDIEDIVFGSTSENGTLVLDIYHGRSGGSSGTRVNVLEEILYPTIDGHIEVTDLGMLLEPYAKQYLVIHLECSFTDDAGTVSVSPVEVHYSAADVGMSASDFLQNNFLTILTGEKITALGREERVYAAGVTTVAITAFVRLVSGQFQTLTSDMNAAITTAGISQFDVSPQTIKTLIALVSGKLLSYTVTAGARTQQFVVTEDDVPPAPSLIFTNSFGCQEFLHCVGTHKKDSKYERSTARIRARLRNYHITESREFTANTGWLNESMADWADELFRSEEVFLWVDGQIGREVVLNDSKSEISNEDDHMPAFEFKYVYAQRLHNVMQPTHAGRIFDNTFDQTFN